MSKLDKARAAFIKQIKDDLSKLSPGNPSIDKLIEYIEGLSDKALRDYVDLLESGKHTIPIAAEAFSDSISQERTLKVAKEIGHKVRQKIWFIDKDDPNVRYLSPIAFPVFTLPVRVLQQTVESKRSIPSDVSIIDDLSGQVTGDSKGSRITSPELQALNSHNIDNTIIEYLKGRGGDQEANRVMEKELMATGKVTTDTIMASGTKVKSTEVASTLLTSAHIKNNLAE